MAKANKVELQEPIESQLLGGEELEQTASLPSYLAEGPSWFSAEEKVAATGGNVVKVLQGKEALAFLGLPTNRPLGVMKVGDLERIKHRFDGLLKQKAFKDPGKFFGAIHIRIWNKQNIDLGLSSETKIVGKETRPHPFTGTVGRYTGELATGKVLEDFLPDVKNSTKPKQFVVQLVSVAVTEEISQYV